MFFRRALSVAAVLSLAGCAVRPTRAGSPSPRSEPGTERHLLVLEDEKTAADEGMRRFDALMRRGGALYELVPTECEREHQSILARLRGLPPDGDTPAERVAALAGGGMPGC